MANPVSQVRLGGVQIDIDPEEYVLTNARRRGTGHKIIGRGTVWQDRGLDLTDLEISFKGRLYNRTTLTALYALSLTAPGTGFDFVDFYGNEFMVLFKPGEQSFVPRMIPGSNGFDYEIMLIVLSCTKWYGVTGGFPGQSLGG